MVRLVFVLICNYGKEPILTTGRSFEPRSQLQAKSWMAKLYRYSPCVAMMLLVTEELPTCVTGCSSIASLTYTNFHIGDRIDFTSRSIVTFICSAVCRRESYDLIVYSMIHRCKYDETMKYKAFDR